MEQTERKEVIIRMLTVKDGKVRIDSDGQIMATRPDIAAVKAIPGNDYNLCGTHHLFEKVEVLWNPNNLGPDDFILSRSSYFAPGMPEFAIHCLAGKKPEWFSYSKLWMDWVYNPIVSASAFCFLRNHSRTKAFREALTYCEHNPFTEQAVAVWQTVIQACLKGKVAKKMDRYLSRCNYSNFVLKAMPVKLAISLGGWRPPIPKPQQTPLPPNLHIISISE